MQRTLLIFSFFAALVTSAQSPQFTQFSIEEYVMDYLVEPGAVVTNIQFTGQPEQIGYAYNMGSVGYGWPWEEAVILCGTWAEIAINDAFNQPIYIDAYTDPAFNGPNTVDDGGVYADLLNLSNECLDLLGAVNEEGLPIFNTEIFDVAAIEFDVIPTNDTLVFKYNLGGLEFQRSANCYPVPYGLSYASCEYNDIFGIFVSGPGLEGDFDSPPEFPNGSVNVAYLPETEPPLPVCTTAINDSTNTEFYVPYCELVSDTTIFGFCDTEFGFGVFTTIFEHRIPVICGQTYHIKIAIGDVFDHIYSTYAFLGAIGGTGNSGYNPTVNFSFQPLTEPTSQVFEDCDPVFLNVIRSQFSNLALADTILIFQDGQAQMFDDFSLIPDTVIIPAFENSVSLQVDIYDDGIAEVEEQLILFILPASMDEMSCASYANILVLDEAQSLVADGSTIILCDSGEAILQPDIQGGYGLYNFLWSNGSEESTLVLNNPDPNIEYFVVVGDTCGMAPDTAWFALEAVMELSAEIFPDSLAYGCETFIPISVNVEGGYGDLDYLWLPIGINAPDVEYNSFFGPGTISVLVQDECGTTAQDSVIIYLEDADPFLYTGSEIYPGGCQGMAIINANISGGFDPIQYIWSTPEGVMFGETIEVAFDEPVLVTLIATDICGQLIVQAITITDELDELVIELPSSISGNCAQIFDFTPEFSGGHGPYEFSWQLDGELVSSDSLWTGVQFDSDVVIDLIIDDACGQSETGSTNFELISTPILVNPIEDVAGNCFELVDLLAIASGGDGELNYEWISDGEVIGTGNLILFNLLPGMDEIVLQITDDCGQSETVSIATEYTGSELVVDLGEDIVANCTEVFYVEAQTQGETGDVLFTWEINGEELVGFTTIAEVVMNSSGTISVTASDDCAFEVTDELFVEVFADPIFGEEVIVDLCMADTVEISIITQGGTGLFTYHWPAGIGSSSESFFFNEPQIFTVEVVDVCDQTIAIPVQITFTEPIAGITTQYLGPGLWHFTSEYTCNSCEYYWDFGDGFDAQGINTDHEYDFALDHLLTLTYINEQGCEAQAYYLVESENTLFIPNSFTPNNDGVNDVFSVVALGFSEFYIRIFNRWGELVFESTKEAETWTGNYQNGDHYVPDGTYVYIVHLLDQKKIPQIINGSVTLFR